MIKPESTVHAASFPISWFVLTSQLRRACVLATLVAWAGVAPVLGWQAGAEGTCEILPFSDDFELPMEYELFEEIVVPGCYGSEQASFDRSMECSQSGNYSLLLWSNASPATPPLNNHVIVFKKLADCGTEGRFLYKVSFKIDPSAGDFQTVEGSLQNTIPTNGETLTKIGAIQYQGNPFVSPPCRWAVWTGHPTPSWQIFLDNVCLENDVWYTLDFDIEWDTSDSGIYGIFQIKGGNIAMSVDLSNFPGGSDERGFEPAFVVTVEDEALDNGCDSEGDFDLRVFFDDLMVTPLEAGRGIFFDGFECGNVSKWSSSTS